MRDMSRAIRHELEDLGGIQNMPDSDLKEVTEIVGAFFYDLVGEQDRRGWGSPRPAASVAAEIKRLKARVTAHHELSTLSQEAIAESLGGQCRICERAIAGVDRPSDPAGVVRPVDGDGDGGGSVAA